MFPKTWLKHDTPKIDKPSGVTSYTIVNGTLTLLIVTTVNMSDVTVASERCL
jgi:hypothetical protein